MVLKLVFPYTFLVSVPLHLLLLVCSSVLLQFKHQFNKLTYYGVLRLWFLQSLDRISLSPDPSIYWIIKLFNPENKSENNPSIYSLGTNYSMQQLAQACASLVPSFDRFWFSFFLEKLEHSSNNLFFGRLWHLCKNFYFQGRYRCQLSQIIEHYLL